MEGESGREEQIGSGWVGGMYVLGICCAYMCKVVARRGIIACKERNNCLQGEEKLLARRGIIACKERKNCLQGEE